MPGKSVVAARGPFTFRQRAGRLDWRKVSSIDIEDVVLNLKVEELQVLLDTVTFSEFDALEVKSNTIQHVTKLVNLMQLIIEYLLHHQEHQFHLVRKQTKKIEHLIEKNDTYQRRLETMKEDVRTYQRQLHILRKSIQAGGGGINTELLFRLVQKDPKVTDPAALNTRNTVAAGEPMNMELVKIMLDHEHEARSTMHQILEEQRRLFQAELSNLHESIRRIQYEHEKQQENNEQHNASNKDAWNTATITLLLENMKAQMENTARQMMDSMKENMRPAVNASHTNLINNNNNRNVDDILQQAAMETYSRELSDREAALQRKEEDIKRRELILQQLQQNENTTNLQVKQNDVLFRRQIALKYLFSACQRVNQRRLLKRFRRWCRVVSDLQQQALLDEHAKQLLFASEKRIQQDSFSQSHLQEEKQKVMILQARYNALQRELEALQESSKVFEMKAEQADRMEAVLQEKLKLEKEKSVVAQAKYNALQQRVDKDKDGIQGKLLVAEEIIANQASQIADLQAQLKQQQANVRLSRSGPLTSEPALKRQDEGVMTSMSFLSPIQAKVNPNKKTSSSSSSSSRSDTRIAALKAADALLARQRETLFSELDHTPTVGASREDIFLRNAEERALAKTDVETVKQLAMATLAQDFLAKYK